MALVNDVETSLPLSGIRAVRRLRITPNRTHEVTIESRFHGALRFVCTGAVADEIVSELRSALQRYTDRSFWVDFEDRFRRWPYTTGEGQRLAPAWAVSATR
jgi:hypothetical protein